MTTTGFPPVLSVGELDQPGKAVAAPFEKLHAAQRQKIKEAMIGAVRAGGAAQGA